MSPCEIYIVHVTWERGGKTRPELAFIVDENLSKAIYTTASLRRGAAIAAQYNYVYEGGKYEVRLPSGFYSNR